MNTDTNTFLCVHKIYRCKHVNSHICTPIVELTNMFTHTYALFCPHIGSLKSLNTCTPPCLNIVTHTYKSHLGAHVGETCTSHVCGPSHTGTDTCAQVSIHCYICVHRYTGVDVDIHTHATAVACKFMHSTMYRLTHAHQMFLFSFTSIHTLTDPAWDGWPLLGAQ